MSRLACVVWTRFDRDAIPVSRRLSWNSGNVEHGSARGGAMRRNQSGSQKTDSRSFYFRFRSPCQHLLPSTRLASDYDMKGCHRFSSHVKLNDSWHVINAPINILDATYVCVAGKYKKLQVKI